MENSPYAATGSRKGCLIGCGAVLVLALIVALGLYGTFKSSYNNLVHQDQQVKGAWAQVENDLQRRSDLIPNLVGSVKGITQHEEKVFGQIADARARIGGAGAGPSDAKLQASNDMSSAISRLLVITENYPQLKSNENFMMLQDEVTGTENRLAHSREAYNRTVGEYNVSAKSFPLTLFVRTLGFKPEQPFFEAPKDAKARPTVDFSK
jgi:LemA protein